jgi:hypothetical protein
MAVILGLDTGIHAGMTVIFISDGGIALLIAA